MICSIRAVTVLLDQGRLTLVYSKCRVTVDNSDYLTLHPIDPQIREERSPNIIDSGTQ